MKNLVDIVNKAKEEGRFAIHKLVDSGKFEQVVEVAQTLSIIEGSLNKISKEYRNLEKECIQLVNPNKTIPVPNFSNEPICQPTAECELELQPELGKE